MKPTYDSKTFARFAIACFIAVILFLILGSIFEDSWGVLLSILSIPFSFGTIYLTIKSAKANEKSQTQASTKKEEPQRTQEKELAPKPKTNPSKFIPQLNQLNSEIQDPLVTEALFKTCSLITQLRELQNKFPNTSTQVEELWNTHIPQLIRVVDQFAKVDGATSNTKYEDSRSRLLSIIAMINQAMEKTKEGIIDSSMDNLSADMDNLTALLQKEGLVQGNSMEETLRKVKEKSE